MGSSIYGKYAPGHDFRGKHVLNAGCGTAQYKLPNVVNMDAYDICKPDVVHNLEITPLPFKDNEFDLIIANHVLEHVRNWWDCFKEFARIVKDNGIIEINLPGNGNDTFNGFRDHVSYINNYSFYGIFDCKRPATNAWAQNETQAIDTVNRIKTVSYTRILDAKLKWIKYAPMFMRRFAMEHLRNIETEQRFVFTKMSVEEYKKRSVVYDIHSGNPV
jgi:SAM-dependent methyltransferase